jgi:uncharacterized protein (TIGR02453 family)
MQFTGFGSETLRFLQDLAFNNDREWFAANKDRYEAAVRGPSEAFILALGPRLAERYPTVVFDVRRNGAGSLMRVHRDVRFSADKRPYKENVGIIFPLAPGKKVEVPIFYFHIEAGRSFFYGGQHVFSPEVLARYRAAVDDGRTGPALERILAGLSARGLAPMEDPAYKRVPRPFPADHPRAALLRQAALGVGADFFPDDLSRSDLVDRCRAAADAMEPLMAWLEAMNGRR